MDEQRLIAIERDMQRRSGAVVGVERVDLEEMIDVIRQLQRENHLLNLSRGTPSVVGRD